ncbi:MAG: hypothetical protein EKK31_11595 [Hyphomicrobiales bacterium]|nr:MAG: hypothetical protein EKK31_11595 [Hyphomicrobiales bacterium]
MAMRKSLFGLLPVAALAACQTASIPSDSYRPILKNYYACVLVRADRYAATSNEDPYYLALASRDACGRERQIAQEAVFASERPAVAGRIWKIYDDGLITDMTARITRKRQG